MRRSYKPRKENWTKEGSLWVRSKEILRNQRGYLNPYILGASVPAGVSKTNLISWWNLDEESGTRNDAHGTNHLTDNNTVLYAAGKVGNAAQFVRANLESLVRGDNASLSTGDIDFTIGAWIYLDDVAATGTIMSKYDVAVPTNSEYQLLFESGAKQAYVSYVGGSTETDIHASSFGVLSVSTWYLVLGWHDSINNTINIQVNDGTVDSVAHTAGVNDSTYGLVIGARHSVDPQLFFNGRIDSVAFFKRILTADERTWLYNSGNGRQYSDL